MIFLCLGNSLTSGYPGYSPSIDGISKGFGNPKSQYEYWLKNFCLELLQEKKIKINNLKFINKGIPGELTNDIIRRIEIDMLNYIPKPNYSIILGGSNDLGWNLEVDEICENIIKLHKISRENNIISIGATIPPIRNEISIIDYNKKKKKLNNILKDYFKKKLIPFANLNKGMSDENGNLKKEYAYPDGLHFTVEGYHHMAYVIFEETIKSLIKSKFQ